MMDDLKDRLSKLIQSHIEGKNIDLVELSAEQRNKIIVITVLVDKPDGGISLDECTSVNRFLATTLEENEGIVSGEHTIEVSSPGLDRPLITVEDFFP